MDQFIANEATTHLRADQFESSGQVISRLVIVVLQLVQDLYQKFKF